MAEDLNEPVSDPVAVVDQWQSRAWGECDLSVVDEMVAERFVRHNLSGTQVRDHEQLKADVREYRNAFGRPVVEIHDRVVDGDKVWVRSTVRGANLHTGEPRSLERIQIYRIENGRIAELWSLHASDVAWE